ncbi:MAG: DUF4126 domain-containing protein [Bryobacter sp.]|nr:DUF4126 domain-containing protein [Bryobacter sp.]
MDANLLQNIASFLGLGLASGINLYAAVLTVGLAARMGWITGLPQGLEVLSHPVVLGVAGVLYAAEFIADKVPGFTPFWDGIHTFIRPIGGALLAFGATAKLDPMVQVLAVIAGGSVALGAHATKMGTRLAAHAVPDPVTHSAVSLVEDFSVVGLLMLAYHYPWVALALSVAALVGISLALPFLVRILRFFLRTLGGRLFPFDPDTDGEIPDWARPNGGRTLLCFVRSGKNLGNLRRGYLELNGAGGTLRLAGVWGRKEVGVKGVGAAQRGLFLDVLPLEAERPGDVTIYLTKDWSRYYHAETPAVQTVGA